MPQTELQKSRIGACWNTLIVGSRNIIQTPALVPDMPWLGGPHDGFPRTSGLGVYTWLRMDTIKNYRDTLALCQSALSFGFLELITGLDIPERCFLRADPLDPKRLYFSFGEAPYLLRWIALQCDINPDRQAWFHEQSLMAWAALDDVVLEVVCHSEYGMSTNIEDSVLLTEWSNMICSFATLYNLIKYITYDLDLPISVDCTRAKNLQTRALQNVPSTTSSSRSLEQTIRVSVCPDHPGPWICADFHLPFKLLRVVTDCRCHS